LKKFYHLNEDVLAVYLSKIYEKTHLIENDKISYRKRKDNLIENDKISNDIKSLKENRCCDGRSGHAQHPAKKPLILGKDGKAKDSPQHRLSVQLFKAVRKKVEGVPNQLPKRDPQTGKRNWTQWDRTFHEFLSKWQITEQNVTDVITWYASHIGKEFVPQVYSARTFCEKYQKMLDAIERKKRDADRERKEQQKRNGETPTGDYTTERTYIDKKGRTITESELTYGPVTCESDRIERFPEGYRTA
jgi:hypothetical protein